jgi:predicted enzyme related to lactoylglutathione lyase
MWPGQRSCCWLRKNWDHGDRVTPGCGRGRGVQVTEAVCRGRQDGAGGPGAQRPAGTTYRPVMKTSGITAALPAQDLGRAKAFYVEKVGLQALESRFLKARDGQVGLTVGDGVNQLFVYPARVRPSGEFTQAVIHVTDVRAAVEEMRVAACSSRSTTRRRHGPRTALPGCRVEARRRGFKDPEGNLVGVVPA